MAEQPPFPESYNTLPVPEAIDIATDEIDEERLAEIRTAFFDTVKRSLQLDYAALFDFCETKQDDTTTTLWFGDLQPLASTTESSDESGRHLIFTKKPLAPRTAAIIKDLRIADMSLRHILDHLD